MGSIPKAASLEARLRISAGGRHRFSIAKETSSRHEVQKIWLSKLWKTTPTRAASSGTRARAVSAPSSRIVPRCSPG
jgi:hypothetical protein